jgi:hypothetical protein
MQQKELIAFVLLFGGVCSGVVLASLSSRVRDYFFMLMVFLTPMTERFDVNFVSRDWYRGTVRGFEVSLVDILSLSVLISSVLVPRRGQSRIYWPASFGLILLFFAYCCVNVALSDPMLFGLFELSKMVRGITIFLAVALFLRSERELRMLIGTLAVLVCFQGMLAFKQRYIDGMHRVAGTIDDSNSLSFFFCMTAPLLATALASRIPRALKILCGLAIPLACVGTVLTISRTGVTTLALALFFAALATVSWRITARKIIITLVVLIGATGIVAKSWKTLQARFSESNLETEYGNKRTMGRGYYIRVANAIAADRTLGVGLNNWSFWVSNKYGPRLGYRFVAYKGTDKEPTTLVPPDSNVDAAQAAPAHSLGALTVGELGFPGLVLFGILWLRWFQMSVSFLWRRTPEVMRRFGVGIFIALCAMFLHSLTEWVFRQSPISYMVHVILGTLAGLCYEKRRARKLAAIPVAEAPLSVPDEFVHAPGLQAFP